jgi:molybdopterin/thiamine biosynthesis adenylyltransferase
MVGKEIAHYPTAQHLTWMLVNLLARQTYEIHEIELIVPEDIPVAGRLSPLISETQDLRIALQEGISHINSEVLVAKTMEKSRISVRIGPGPLSEADFALATTAYGWSGYVGQASSDILGEDNHPIGAYIAASLCAGEIFKFVRGMAPEAGTFAQGIWLDGALLQISRDVSPLQGPVFPSDLCLIPAVVAGIGAVGCGMLHTLYPLTHIGGELTLIDGDPKGVDETNLNRYALFGLEHVLALKASLASQMFTECKLVTHPIDESWQAWYSRESRRRLDLVISAVDKNSARHAIQAALPRLILGSSTNEMRAQVNLYDVLHGGPCLRCRNRIEEGIPDDVVIAHLHNLTVAERMIEAQRVGIVPSDLETFLVDPHGRCGMISGEILQKFANRSGQEEWSVGFVSLLAGVLLAAEYLKMSINPTQTALDAQHNTFRFQFWHPESAEVNTIVGTPPEAGCFCQSSTFRRAAEFSVLY